MSGVVDLRVMSYNVRSLRDDRHALARVIRTCRPDVVCVQEAPRFLRWRAKCAWLARESGLVVVTGGRCAGATLVLANLRVSVRATADVALPKSLGRHRRGVAAAVLDVDGVRFAVASMHMSLDAVERRGHLARLREHLDGLGAARLILAGDLNEDPGGPTWQALTSTMSDAHAGAPWAGVATFPARAPWRRIDAVFVSPGIRTRRCGVPDADVTGMARASDHRPVVADLLLDRDG